MQGNNIFEMNNKISDKHAAWSWTRRVAIRINYVVWYHRQLFPGSARLCIRLTPVHLIRYSARSLISKSSANHHILCMLNDTQLYISYPVPPYQIYCIKLIQKCLACGPHCWTYKFSHITPTLHSLHWLVIIESIEYKILSQHSVQCH